MTEPSRPQWCAGLAGYFPTVLWRDPDRVERIAKLVLDPRWPHEPTHVKFAGLHKRDDRASVRVSAKTGGRVREGLLAAELSCMRLYRSRPRSYATWIYLDTGRIGEAWSFEAPFDLECMVELSVMPEGKSFEGCLGLLHELVTATGAIHATLGIWPTHEMTMHDITLIRTILDTRWGEYNLSLPERYADQVSLVSIERKFIGKTYARHPRWGTYLNAAHVAAIGGVERIHGEVAPARIDRVGDLTYIQLTETFETALSPDGAERRRKLEALMAPIVVRA